MKQVVIILILVLVKSFSAEDQDPSTKTILLTESISSMDSKGFDEQLNLRGSAIQKDEHLDVPPSIAPELIPEKGTLSFLPSFGPAIYEITANPSLKPAINKFSLSPSFTPVIKEFTLSPSIGAINKPTREPKHRAKPSKSPIGVEAPLLTFPPRNTKSPSKTVPPIFVFPTKPPA